MPREQFFHLQIDLSNANQDKYFVQLEVELDMNNLSSNRLIVCFSYLICLSEKS